MSTTKAGPPPVKIRSKTCDRCFGPAMAVELMALRAVHILLKQGVRPAKRYTVMLECRHGGKKTVHVEVGDKAFEWCKKFSSGR